MTATREPLLTAAGAESVYAVVAELRAAGRFTAPTTVPGCQHSPPCPTADRPDHDAAVAVFHDDNLDATRLCNGVWVFHDGGELVPDDSNDGGPCHCHDVPAHRGPARHNQPEGS